jgi:hypothetical protein
MNTNVPFKDRISASVDECCAAVGIGRSLMYELIRNKEVETRTEGRRRLILVPSLLRRFNPGASK